jgi:CDP-paratose 2-epimerase
VSAASDPVVVTGGAGFIGSNLADHLARDGRKVIIFDALSRPGVERNLAWLRARHGARVETCIADIRDASKVDRVIDRASAVFHLAAQVAVTTSLLDPRADFAINVGGTLNVLEAARRRGVPLVFASTNKVYGDLADIELQQAEGWRPADPALAATGIDERRPLDFHTPYGCSKGAADQYVLDYARSYGLPACVLRMSCVYGRRQLGTEDQGWVAHFLIQALDGRPITLYGDGQQVRDILHVDDAIAAYVAALERIETVSGRAFNLGGGPANAVSLTQVVTQIEQITGRRAVVERGDWRAGDQRYFVADARAARDALDLPQPYDWTEGLEDLARWLTEERAVGTTPRDVAA